MVIFGLQMKMM